MIEVVNVMVSDIANEPCHDGACSHVAGGFQRGFFKCPSVFVTENNTWEIVLGIKEVATQGTAQNPG